MVARSTIWPRTPILTSRAAYVVKSASPNAPVGANGTAQVPLSAWTWLDAFRGRLSPHRLPRFYVGMSGTGCADASFASPLTRTRGTAGRDDAPRDAVPPDRREWCRFRTVEGDPKQDSC